jgi:uncharacterized membrane protein
MLGFLYIDSADFTKMNLFLNFFAGMQASIVLMSSNRQSRIDRTEAKHSYKIDEQSLQIMQDSQKKIMKMMHQIEMLEDIIDELIEEKEEGAKDDKGNSKDSSGEEKG